MSPRRRGSLHRQQAMSTREGSITMTATDWASGAQGTGHYAEVNGLNLYYETHGAGRPLILLHGGLGSGEMFGPILPALAERHQVIAPDLQGHGRTADIDRPIDVRLMADDIAALIEHLGLDEPDLVGYSLGGGVALQTAIKYPAMVRRLVAASANIRRDAIYPEMLAQQGQVGAAAAEFMTDTPMYQLYQRVAPRPEDFPRLLDKMGAAMAEDFDFTEEVRGLRVPTLLVEESQGDRREQGGLVQVVVGEAGQDGERVTALGSALPHPAAVAKAAVEQAEDLDVVAWRGHVCVGGDDQRRHL